MFRQNTYTEADFYRVVPVARKMVVPGESASLDVQTHFESVPFAQNVLTGGLMSLYAFYTPIRLVWGDAWIDYLTDPETTQVIPTSSTPAPYMLEGQQARPVNTFGRRSYKLLYNQYFGDEQLGEWFSDIGADNTVSLGRARTTDQMLGTLRDVSDVPDETLTIDSSGATASIPLNELRAAMRQAFSNRRQNMTGDKYVDALRRMGVDLDWRVQNAPEFLGLCHSEFGPRATRVQGETETGRAWAKFSGSCHLKTKRKFFAEHGIIMVVAVVRPHLMTNNTTKPAADSLVLTRDDVFFGDNQAGMETHFAHYLGAAVSDDTPWYTPKWSYLHKGQNLIGNWSQGAVEPWAIRGDMPTVTRGIYPDTTALAVVANQLSANAAFVTRAQITGPSPAKKLVM